MKKTEAIIKPFSLEQIKENPAALGAWGMTKSEVEGFGRRRGYAEMFWGAEYEIGSLSLGAS